MIYSGTENGIKSSSLIQIARLLFDIKSKSFKKFLRYLNVSATFHRIMHGMEREDSVLQRTININPDACTFKLKKSQCLIVTRKPLGMLF